MRNEPGSLAPAGVIPLCVPEIRGNEWTYVKECLDTGWVSSVGAYVDRFEAMLAARTGTRCAVATVNGTAALHTALLVAGVEPDDAVLVSTLSFIAPANAIRYAGAWPVFIDAEPRHWQMDAEKVAEFLEKECRWTDHALRHRTTGRRVKALVPVHILGHPVDMDPLLALARKFGLTVIEDATESLGATYRGRSVGQLGDLACFSFNGNKILTTGGGGMLVTDREDWAQRAKYLSTQAKDDPVEYLHETVGYNYRLTNLQAAMGCAQMEQLDACVAAKRRIAATYVHALAGRPGVTPMAAAPWAESTFWMFTILLDAETAGLSSRQLMRALQERGIQSRPLWQPLHQTGAHRGALCVGGEVAESLQARAVSLPCSVGLTDAQQSRVIAALQELLPAP